MKKVYLAVIVAALGYFVDIYDLILFSIVRVPSLKSLGLSDAEITSQGILLLNLQMGGMLLGGILFGILGDRKGRLSVLFGSIFLYSLANFLNGWVQTVEQYAVLRFFAGVGLAGELGAGITLVAEMIPKDKRGYGTTIIAAVGVSGALLAWFMASRFDWRTAYFFGGGLGFMLLLLRVGVLESGLFQNLKTSQHTIRRGDFLSLFTNRSRLRRFLNGIAIGAPLWFVVGILITLSPEFSKALGGLEPVDAGQCVFFCYAGLVVGDIMAGLLSQLLKSRKKAILIFLTGTTLSTLAFFYFRELTANQFYLLTFIIGIFVGYWVLFVTVSAEQFGTNLRATVATTTPNFVRGSLIFISFLFATLKPHLGFLNAGLITGLTTMTIAFIGLYFIDETFHKDLDFTEIS
jgi:MFS transporter, putative metabolite:H+ symporter